MSDVLWSGVPWLMCVVFFFFKAEDGIRDPLWSRGLGDVYKRQIFILYTKIRESNSINHFST